jgi:hypothetical protein
MASKKLRPPTAIGDLGICHLRPASDGPKTSSPTPNLQDHRAQWLARRFRLAPTMASALAGIYFPEAAR